MITNATQLELAVTQLNSFREMLEAMRLHLLATNPGLFPRASEGYLKRIESLESEIIGYLRERPADAPLSVKISGTKVRPGVIRANVASQLLAGLQSAVYQVGGYLRGRMTEGEAESLATGVRSLFALNLVATAPGSFVLSLVPGPQQMALFRENDLATSAVEKVITHINELQISSASYSGDRSTLRGLHKVARVVQSGIDTIEIVYRDDRHYVEGSVTQPVRDRIEELLGAPRQGERTVIGLLIEINVENNTCKIHSDLQPLIDCAYDEDLEDDLIAALRKRIEMAGQFISVDWPPGHFRITRIERFKVIEPADVQAEDQA